MDSINKNVCSSPQLLYFQKQSPAPTRKENQNPKKIKQFIKKNIQNPRIVPLPFFHFLNFQKSKKKIYQNPRIVPLPFFHFLEIHLNPKSIKKIYFTKILIWYPYLFCNLL